MNRSITPANPSASDVVQETFIQFRGTPFFPTSFTHNTHMAIVWVRKILSTHSLFSRQMGHWFSLFPSMPWKRWGHGIAFSRGEVENVMLNIRDNKYWGCFSQGPPGVSLFYPTPHRPFLLQSALVISFKWGLLCKSSLFWVWRRFSPRLSSSMVRRSSGRHFQRRAAPRRGQQARHKRQPPRLQSSLRRLSPRGLWPLRWRTRQRRFLTWLILRALLRPTERVRRRLPPPRWTRRIRRPPRGLPRSPWPPCRPTISVCWFPGRCWWRSRRAWRRRAPKWWCVWWWKAGRNCGTITTNRPRPWTWPCHLSIRTFWRTSGCTLTRHSKIRLTRVRTRITPWLMRWNWLIRESTVMCILGEVSWCVHAWNREYSLIWLTWNCNRKRSGLLSRRTSSFEPWTGSMKTLYCPAVFGHFLDPPGNHPRGAIFPTMD